jgi:glycosyltransferase involved in cell wall biosynthesis
VGETIERRLAPPWYRRTPTVTLSASSRDELVHTLGMTPSLVHVVPPGVDPRFGPGTGRAEHPVVVAVGRLAPVKRFDALVRALAPHAASVPGLELVIVGEGEERARIDAAIADTGSAGWVRMAGRLDDDALVALYRRAWLVTSASLAEGWGMTVTEAAACGTPAVVTDIGGHRDAVVDGVTGELAPLEDLGARIASVLRDRARLDAMASAALARARTLTWDATAAATLDVLVGTVRGGPRRGVPPR